MKRWCEAEMDRQAEIDARRCVFGSERTVSSKCRDFRSQEMVQSVKPRNITWTYYNAFIERNTRHDSEQDGSRSTNVADFEMWTVTVPTVPGTSCVVAGCVQAMYWRQRKL